MSVLSSTQGWPERVWALLNCLHSGGGTLQRSDAEAWLNPRFMVNGTPVKDQNSAFKQTIGAATSLGLITSEKNEDRLLIDLSGYEAFADEVHDRLVALPASAPDYLLLDMFAWLVAALERDETVALDAKSVADQSNLDRNAAAGGDDDEEDHLFNPTKFKTWRVWMSFLGLGVDLTESGGARFFAHVSERLSRILARSSLERNVEIPAETALSVVAKSMPYLDGGALFRPMAERMNALPPAGYLTGVLSRALLDLKQAGEIEFVRLGDAGNLVRLRVEARDNEFQAIVLREGLS